MVATVPTLFERSDKVLTPLYFPLLHSRQYLVRIGPYSPGIVGAHRSDGTQTGESYVYAVHIEIRFDIGGAVCDWSLANCRLRKPAVHQGAQDRLAFGGEDEREDRDDGLPGNQGLQDQWVLLRDLCDRCQRSQGRGLFQPGRWQCGPIQRRLIIQENSHERTI